MHRAVIAAMLMCAGATAQPPQAGVNFIRDAFGSQTTTASLLTGTDFPRLSILFANRRAEAQRRAGKPDPVLRAPGSKAVMSVRVDQDGPFEICRLRHLPGSPIPPDELKLVWAFPMEFNDSMTLDAGALQGHPLYLPDGTLPPANNINWGTLFYNRTAKLAAGAVLTGGEPAVSHWGRRSGPTGPTQLHFWTSMGYPDLEVDVFAWRPQDGRLWWAEWYQREERRSPGRHPNLFPVLSAPEMSWMPGERQKVQIVPGPAEGGKEMEIVIIDDVSGRIAGRQAFRYTLPVTNVEFEVGDWPTGLYRAIVAPPGMPFDPAVRDFSRKMMTLVIRPRRARGSVLFVAPTDMWRAYASNGGHAMTSWRVAHHYDSVGYSPTVFNTRFRRTNHYYYGLYERHSDIHHYRFLHELAERDGFALDYCTQDDIALDRVRLSDYRLVLIGSHAEFTTAETYLRFRDYMARGGAAMIHGGDSFAVMVEYLPSLRDRSYIWQRDHVWCHLTDQADEFTPPRLLPPDAPPDTPITAPEAGNAIDYLNLFHVSVGYWPQGSRAVVCDPDHPILHGLGLRRGDAIPGEWSGEADMTYEPRGWDILLRSDRATTEAAESGLERVKQPAFHHTALMVHRNLRLAVFSGEGFSELLADPKAALFRTIYSRTLHYLLDSAAELELSARIPAGDDQRFEWKSPLHLAAVRYSLPEFIDYRDPLWFRKPAPYAHYVVEGSTDGKTWSVLADRTHGPWRGTQTDFVPPVKLRAVRFRGSYSNHQPFHVDSVEIFKKR